MKDEELEVWRGQWQSLPTVPIDLIRRVERQTVYMQLNWMSQILPGMIGVATVVGAIVTRNLNWVLLAIGTCSFLAIGWRFLFENKKGVWTPTAETTAAYLALSIERCRRKLDNIRFGNVMAVLLTIFVLVADYAILKSENGLATSSDLLAVTAAYSVAIIVVLIVLAFQVRKRRKTRAELSYLLDLQQRLEAGENMDIK